METVGLVISILGVIVSFYAIKLQFFSAPNEELEHLRVQFRANQELSIQVQNELDCIIKKFNVGNKMLFPGITYSIYLENMRSSYKENLSEDLYNSLLTLNLSKSNISSMRKSLEEQFGALSQLHSFFRMQIGD